MLQSAGRFEAISSVSDKELNSISQNDLSTLQRTLSRKPGYKAYKTLLFHRHTIQRLNTDAKLRVEHANDALSNASEDLRNTATALLNACNHPTSPYHATYPYIHGGVLKSVMEQQTFDQRKNIDALAKYRWEQMQVHLYIQMVNKVLEDDERTLVKDFGIRTVDDEGKPLLNEHNSKRMIDVMASVPEIEDL